MLANYCKVAFRLVAKHKAYFLINVLSLTLGICACIVIYKIVSYEFSFDSFHPGKERIYRIGGEVAENNGRTFYVEDVPPPAPNAIRKDISGIEVITSFYPYEVEVTIPGTSQARKFQTEGEGSNGKSIIITDPEYFSIFHYDWLAGSPQSSLKDPFKVVLTQNRAHKYFGSLPVDVILGKEVIYEDSLRVTVSGIVKDQRQNTDFAFQEFISGSTIQNSFLKESHADGWQPGKGWAWSLVKLSKGTTASHVEAGLQDLVRKHMKADPLNKFSFQLQPLSDIHFNSDYDHDGIRKANRPTLFILTGIALFILLIGVINFVNLATAQSIQRAKEIGLRKVLGSSRVRLVVQFYTETVIVVLVAALIALCLVKWVLAIYSDFIPSGLTFSPFQWPTILFMAGVVLATSLLAGFYPAKVLSSYVPIINLQQGGIKGGTGSGSLRRGLIVFQFALSLIFIISSLVISEQIRYMRFSDLGFTTNAIITINNWDGDEGKMQVFAQKIKDLPEVSGVVIQGKAPAFVISEEPISYRGNEENAMMVHMQAGNADFIPFYGIKVVAGRNLIQSDSLREFLINETYAKALGFDSFDKAIDQLLYRNNKSYPIVGVVADFHEGSFHEVIGPIVIGHIPELEKSMGIKLTTTGTGAINLKTTLASMETRWKEVFPDRPLSYSFLDEAIAGLYEKEAKAALLVKAAMVIAIFISCIGLFGLVLFTIEKREKEIGVRKVLGASIMHILGMLSKEIVILVVIALLIASPIAWYFMQQWLQDFAYRIPISGWIFIVAGIAALTIALLSVSFQTLKAALANPVKALRSQ